MTRRHTQAEIAEIKRAVRDRDSMCCTRCGMTNQEHIERYGRSLHVHRTRPGELYSEPSCTTLCAVCHGQATERKPATGKREQEPNRQQFNTRLREEDWLRLERLRARISKALHVNLSRSDILRLALIELEKEHGREVPTDQGT